MSANGNQTNINQERAFYLSSIPTDVIHSTIQVQELDAAIGRFSTLFADQALVSSLNVSTLNFQNSDVSGMYVSSIRGNTAFFSTVTLASDLSGGVGYVRFSVDASGIQVDGDPIRFDNLVYLTSSINIVQVSTIVDTDIFAQNGYFSTLSSQSLQLGAGFFSSLQGGNGSFSSLVVSSLAATDLSGDFAKNWSQYQTLNSSIIFQPSYILSNVSNKLYFAGQELTDASGGGVNWSLFPAISTVNMNNNSLIGLSTLRYQDNATLTSVTGNNLFYNGQPVQFGNASNVSQWSKFPALANVNMNFSTLSNANLIATSNLTVSGSNITNGNTFTNSLGVGGTSLVSLASINSLGQLSCQDIDVGSALTGLADVNIYGATALPGDSALYVQGGVQFDGGTIHGFSAGVLPVAGVNTGRIDMLQAGFNLLHPLVGAITTGAALGITAGGALSLAGGGYIEMNTSTLQMINTSQGNKNTTVQAGFLTVDPDIAPTSSIKLFNTLGGGVEIDGGGQGSLKGFSTVQGSNLSSINLDVSTINGVDWQDISGSVFTTASTFSRLYTSSIQLSSIVHGGFPGQREIIVDGNGLNFKNADPSLNQRYISSLQYLRSPGINLDIEASTIGISYLGGVNPNGAIRLGAGGAFDTWIIGNQSLVSTTAVQANSVRFSTATSVGSNAAFNYPIYIEYDQANNLSTGGVAIAVQGHNFGFGAARSQIEFGARGNSENYIMSVWPGQNLEDLFIDATDVIFRDGTFSTIVNLDPYGLITNGAISAPSLLVSSITGDEVTFLSSVKVSNAISSLKTTFSTIQLYNDFTNLGASSMMNIGVGYNTAAFPFPSGLWFENYVNSVDNLDIFLTGNSDGATITSWTNNRSTLSELFIAGNTISLDIDNSVIVSQGTSNTVLTGTSVSTSAVYTSSINNNNAQVAYANILTLSTMNLFQNSTTLLHWSTATTSCNINFSNYDIQPQQNGTYKFGISFQFNNTSGNDAVEYFFQKNNSSIPYTGTIHTVQNNTESTAYVEIVEPMNSTDTLQVGCYTTSADVTLSTINGNIEICPAAILTAYKLV